MHRRELPTLDVVAPDRRRVTIRAREHDRVSDLLRALGADPAGRLLVEGVPYPSHRRLTTLESLRQGARLDLLDPAPPPDRSAPPGPDRPAAGTVDEHRDEERGSGTAGRRSPSSVVAVAVALGPACTASQPLEVGRHSIGRARGTDVVVADPDVEPHHGVLDVDPDGAVRFTQLTGRVPVRLDGRPVGRSDRVLVHERLELGSSVARVELIVASRPRSATGRIVSVPGDPWRRLVRRGPSIGAIRVESIPALPDTPIDHPRPAATGLIGAGVGIVGALAIATLLGQPMFAAFALIGAFAAFATWAAGVVTAARRTRRSRAASRLDLERFVREVTALGVERAGHHRDDHDMVSSALSVVDGGIEVGDRTALWSRRIADADALPGTLGEGDVVRALDIDPEARARLPAAAQLALERAERLTAVPAPIDLAAGTATGLHAHGDRGRGLARAIIVQLAVLCGPADWGLIVVADRVAPWRWCEWLPHARSDRGSPSVHCAADIERIGATVEPAPDEGRLRLVVVDAPGSLGSRTGPLRRLLAAEGVAALVLVDADDTAPSICTSVLSLGSTGTARWVGGGSAARPSNLRVAGLDEATAEACARRLAPLVDPESVAREGDHLASDVHLAELLDDGVDESAADAIVRRWRGGGSDPRTAAPIGRSQDGSVDIDLVRDGPHGLVAGTTGGGKSELLRTLVVSLAAHVAPEHLGFLLVDYKGGATFDACTDLPHTLGVVTDLDDGLAERALVSLEAELRRREVALRDAGAADLSTYRTHDDVPPIPRLVVVVDEFAALSAELPDFLHSLVGIAQRGRSLGVHLLLATQRPAGIVSDEIRANTNLRLALRLTDAVDAHDVVGDDLPVRFPRGVPGRAAMRLGPDELISFQTACCSAPAPADASRLRVEGVEESGAPGALRAPVVDGPSALRETVAAIRRAAQARGWSSEPDRAGRLWCEPLPSRVSSAELAGHLADVTTVSVADAATSASCAGTAATSEAVGIVDDPAEQCRRPLCWNENAGNLALVGSLASGAARALPAIAAAKCRARSDRQLHLYVIDAVGEAGLDALARIAHCGGVVRVREHERLARLLRRLVDEIDERSSRIGTQPNTVVVLVAGLGALRAALAAVDDLTLLARLDRVLSEGPAVGIVSAFTLDGAATAIATPTAERWVFHVDDPTAVRAVVGSVPPVPAGAPGRLRVGSSGLEAQLAFADDDLSSLPRREPGRGPAEIGTLPEWIRADELPAVAGARRRACSRRGGDDAGMRSLLVGLSDDDLAPDELRLPPGDHVFIGGLARTGKTVALARVEAAWRRAVPTGRTFHLSRDSASDVAPLSDVRPTTGSIREEGPTAGTAGLASIVDDRASGPVLFVVDDAERVEDSSGVLRDVIDGRHPHVTIAIAARLDAVRSSYGHWTRDIARSRCGLIMTAAGEVDGDLLGVALPRRPFLAPRPGLGWLVDGSGHRLVQVAMDD